MNRETQYADSPLVTHIRVAISIFIALIAEAYAILENEPYGTMDIFELLSWERYGAETIYCPKRDYRPESYNHFYLYLAY